ncbi:MAG: aminotransferase class I/II-fold pyridoxal phosphate-dependent enzyme, partial [candidate division Zixibacteria bacterium]|nr:aminotransferase class I/II-fold pyridoxal phosphate-dependent enzyme [candidate division Zixibacteria bacterium]
MPIKKVIVEKANRLYRFPPEIMSLASSERKRSLRKKTDVLDLAGFNWPVGFDSAESSPHSVLSPVETRKLDRLKEELADWYLTVHGARLNPSREIFIGAGISSSIFGLSLAFIDNGDIAFVPDLAVPLYKKVTTACGGESVGYSISTRDNWRPNFERVGTRLGRVARVLFVNSPHNPTGYELDEKDMADLVWTAGRENIMIINDAAYQTISERKVVSLMGIDGGRKVGVEVGSFAYHFGLPPL